MLAAVLLFEVASIRPSTLPPSAAPAPVVAEDRVDYEWVTLRYLLAFAYGVRDDQLQGPAWLNEAGWQLHAKGPAGTTREQLPAMMQNLLAERFGVRVHRETREADGLALVVGPEGPKLKRVPAGGGFRQGAILGGGGRIDADGMSMSRLASSLTNVLGRPVLDATELPGFYAFSLEYAAYEAKGGTKFLLRGPAPSAPASEPDPGTSVFRSIQRLGLRLEHRKFPRETIIVDHAEKAPSEN